MGTSYRLSKKEALEELCKFADGTIGDMPTVENHCDECSWFDRCGTVDNVCRRCGEKGTLYISWREVQGHPYFWRECRSCHDVC